MNFIAYRRVSTQKQGRSGLGLESQEQMIGDYVARMGGTVIAAYTEIESGRKDDRPELTKALAHAKKAKAVLLVAKLDRLARSVSFVSNLLDSGVEFKACDFPEANRMLIQMLSVFGEYEARCISERTKAALQARKARGLTVGNAANLRPGAGVEQHQAEAAARADRMRPIIADIQKGGETSFSGICRELNQRGYKTETGQAWHPMTVSRLMGRLAPTHL